MPVRTLVDSPEVEYLDGQPCAKVSPKVTHGVVQGAMYRLLYRDCGRHGRVGTEIDFHVGRVDGSDSTFVPDVAYVARERLATLDPRDREEPPFAPDIAVEVWSPSNDRRYLDRKISKYLATGAIVVLDVDPYARTIVAHDASSVRTYGRDDTFTHPGVSWLRFEVREAFADLDG